MIIDDATKSFIDKMKEEGSKIIETLRPKILSEEITAIDRLKLLMAQYGSEWLKWENADTLWQAIKDDFKINDIMTNYNYREEKDQIMALKTAILTDSPWVDFNIFENCGQAFNGNPVNFSYSQPLSPAQCCHTMTVLNYIRQETPGDEVQKYIAVSFKERGYVYLPKIVEFAQDELDMLGNDLTLKEATKAAWEKIKSSPLETVHFSDEMPVDIQIARLFSIREFLKEKLGGSSLLTI